MNISNKVKYISLMFAIIFFGLPTILQAAVAYSYPITVKGDYSWGGAVDRGDVRHLLQHLDRWKQRCQGCNFNNNKRITQKDFRYLLQKCSDPPCKKPTSSFVANANVVAIISSILLFTDYQVPVVSKGPEDALVLEKTPVTFSVEATGKRIWYQWQVNGENIPGAKKASFTLPAAELLDHGKLYRCILTSPVGSVTTRAAELQVEMAVPPNEIEVTGFKGEWQNDKVSLTWDSLPIMRYFLYRGASSDTTELIGNTETPPYLDDNTGYHFRWYYRIATVKTYTHPVSSKVYHAVGPLSLAVDLAGQRMVSVQLLNARMQDDGSYISTFIPGTAYKGIYFNIEEPVTVTATGPTTITTQGAKGTFSLKLPQLGQWQISVTETGGYRKGKTSLLLVQDGDTTAPTLILHTGLEMTTTASTVTISGEAHDTESGLETVYVESDQYEDLGGFFDTNGYFQIDVPVKVGENNLRVVAKDKSGNASQAMVEVQATVPALPQLEITSPVSGTTIDTEAITVEGTVRSSLPPEQIRLFFGGQVYFPESSGNNDYYTFSFENVILIEGDNTFRVTAETTYGSVSAQVLVRLEYPQDPEDPEDPEEPGTPAIQIYSPRPYSHLTASSFLVSGIVTADSDITSVIVNGASAHLTGSGTKASFQQQLYFAGQHQDITVLATDSNGESSAVTFPVYHDDGPPTLELTSSLLPPPHVNSVLQTPYTLQGIVTDGNPAGFSINEQSFGLLPGEAGKYYFNVDLPLGRGVESIHSLKVWDQAGNSDSASVVLRLDAGLDIAIISPRPGVEIYTDSDTIELDITFMILGMAEDDQVQVSIDGQIISGLERNNFNVHGVAELPLANGEHNLVVKVSSAAGVTLAQTVRKFVVVDTRLIPLELSRQEPANNSDGAANNSFIGFYFNRPVDPALLDIEVLETFHGKGYTQAPPGADLTSLSTVEMEEIHRDRQPVPGGISHFPAKTMVAFHPETNFAFGATVYVNISYDGRELANTTFTIKPLPTFLQGFIADQFGDKIEGLTVAIPKLQRSAITDKEGSFSFGFGDTAEQILPAGRYKLTANPDMANRRFGSTEFYATVESGRLNEIGVNKVPVMNSHEPFRRISSGSFQAILAAGELTLDLSDATLEFPNGKATGDVHAQFLSLTEQPYSYINGAAPQWVFNLNPNGIEVSGHVGIAIKMPALAGSHEYLTYIGERVVLVGLDSQSLLLVPIGVGRVDSATRMVTNEGVTSLQRLDIIGLGMVDQDKQLLLEEFSNGEIGLNELINKLEQQ